MKGMVIIAVLVPVVLSSALGVVYAKHQSRKLFVQLNELQQQRGTPKNARRILEHWKKPHSF